MVHFISFSFLLDEKGNKESRQNEASARSVLLLVFQAK